MSNPKPRIKSLVAMTTLIVVGNVTLMAATLTWDGDTTAPGLQDGSGNWNTTATDRWYNDSTSSYQAWSNATPDTPVFGNGGSGDYIVTLDEPITAYDLYFNSGGNYTITGNTLTFSHASLYVNEEAVIESMISGSAGLYKHGNAKLILPNANNYTGTTDVRGGAMSIRHSSALGSTNYCHVFDECTLELEGDISVNRGMYIGNNQAADTVANLRNVSGNNTWSGYVNLHGSHPYARVEVADGTTLTVTGPVQHHGSGTGSLTKLGTGTLVLSSNSSNYLGDTHVDEGVLRIRSSNALGSTTAPTTVASGAALEIENNAHVGAEALTLNGTGIGGTGSLRSTGGDNTWDGPVTESSAGIGVDAGTLTINGTISGSGTFRKYGAGTLILTGDNNYAATTDVAAGILNIRHNNALGLASYCHVYSGATLELENDITVSRYMYLGNSSTSDTTLGLRNVSGDNVWNGSVRLHDGHPYARIGVDAGSSLTINGVIQPHPGVPSPAAGSVTKVGDGSLVLTGDNTYTGPTYVDEGVLNIRHSGALGTADTGTTVTAGAALEIEGGITVAGESLTINGTGISAGGALRSVSGDNVWNGTITESSAGIGVDAGTLTISGQISGSGTFRKYGAGKLIFTADNNYAATTDVADGVLNIQHNNALGLASYCHVYSGATLELENDINDITVARGLYIGNNSPSDTTLGLHNVDGNNTWTGFVRLHGNHPYGRVKVADGTTLTITGPVEKHGTGTGSLRKLGEGTLLLTSNSSDYLGETYVDQGTLQVDGSIVSSPSVTVGLDGVLQGTGSVSPIHGAGLLSPGGSAGILTTPSVDPSGGLDFAFEFANLGGPDYGSATNSGNDVLRLTDAADPFEAAMDGSNHVNVYFDVDSLGITNVVRGGFFAESDFLGSISGAAFSYYVRGDGGGSHVFNQQPYYTLAEYDPGLPILFSTVQETANFGSGNVSGYVMQFAAVPEPGTLVLLALGGLCLGFFRCRKRSNILR